MPRNPEINGPQTAHTDLLALPLLDNVDFPECPQGSKLSLGTQLHEARAALAGQGMALLTPRFFRFELGTGAWPAPAPFPAAGTPDRRRC